jgi:hypothetical protein
MSDSSYKRIMKIAELRVAGKMDEAKAEIEQLQRDYPRATPEVTEQVLSMMLNHMRVAA